ncbi:CoA transferase [Cryobacterium sp. TMT1-3]|uniref:CoA transferase n=1 Tax=Cryobacterium luteum TaxID=1424661 RepID=A0A5F0D0C3_9MICO|nr:CoA transferase [Cryobacterium luteum]TFC29144.1 CoA transferase [Cryobacterium sp. TMT1-3]
MTQVPTAGPLVGIRVVEVGSIGPGPHAAMILADLGADVLRIERERTVDLGVYPKENDTTLRGRTRLQVDLRDITQREHVLDLVDRADVLIEGFRPGVAEKLGIGPNICLGRNPALVYGRMTGWGQTGPFAHSAGHDINYLSVTGILDAIGPADGGPIIPLNLVGDFGGGSMFLVVGVLAALAERQRSGRGQVIDSAMTDGASVLAHMMWNMRAHGTWQEGRGHNFADGSHPFYDTYRCADGKYVAVGALEPPFFAQLLFGLELEPQLAAEQWNRELWPILRELFAGAFASRSRDEWAEAFAGTDACVTPVLSFDEARLHPQLMARHVIGTIAGIDQPMPAPRFSRTPPAVPPSPLNAHAPIADALARWGAPVKSFV